MLTEFLRDHAFTIGWFGLMSCVWFGWGQEAPPRSWRPWLGVGSVLGLILAIGFSFIVYSNWATATALEGHYAWFGVLVGAEVLLAGLGCFLLYRRGEARWMAWWVALIIALHFLPLAFLLRDLSLVVLGVVQLLGLIRIRSHFRTHDGPTSKFVGPWMGATLLVFGFVSLILYVSRFGLSL